MTVRIALVHDGRQFRDELAAALRHEGHKVVAFAHPAGATILSHVEDRIEILITRIVGQYPGVKIDVTSVPTICNYNGGWSAILAEPLTVDDIVRCLRSLLPVSP